MAKAKKKKCIVCNKKFEYKRESKTTCSGNCRFKLWYINGGAEKRKADKAGK